jgi:succinate dehydrogenase/fumarate reductase flavoprotein subunit
MVALVAAVMAHQHCKQVVLATRQPHPRHKATTAAAETQMTAAVAAAEVPEVLMLFQP